jgi:hypothetical protein
MASARSDTRGRERTTAVGGAHGEAVSGGAVKAWHVRRRGREAAVGTSARGPDSAFKAPGRVAATRRWRADRQARRGKRRLTGGPLRSVISELKFTPRRKLLKIKSYKLRKIPE